LIYSSPLFFLYFRNSIEKNEKIVAIPGIIWDFPYYFCPVIKHKPKQTQTQTKTTHHGNCKILNQAHYKRSNRKQHRYHRLPHNGTQGSGVLHQHGRRINRASTQRTQGTQPHTEKRLRLHKS